jgi:Flp pilus assembly CpaF family ATPase
MSWFGDPGAPALDGSRLTLVSSGVTSDRSSSSVRKIRALVHLRERFFGQEFLNPPF